MNPAVYPAADVDQILEQSTASIEDLMSAVQSRDEEIARLKTAANDAAVRLQKVGSEQDSTQPDSTLINKVVDQLVTDNYISVEQRSKMASELQNPDNILKLASRILEVSSTTPSQGRGIPKSASVNTDKSLPDGWEEDGWDRVVEN